MESVDTTLVSYILHTFYNITPVEGKIVPLVGYSDKNYAITDVTSGKKYVIKIVNPEDSKNQDLIDIIDDILFDIHLYFKETNEFRAPKLFKTSAEKLSINVEVKQNPEDESSTKTCNVKLFEYVPSVTVRDFINKSSKTGNISLESIYIKLGSLCRNLTQFLVTKTRLRDELAVARADFEWQTSTCSEKLHNMLTLLYPEKDHIRRQLVERVLDEFENHKAVFEAQAKVILHADFSGKNILIDDNQQLTIVDFQDLQVGPRVLELAILMLYSVLEQENVSFVEALQSIPVWLLKGYCEHQLALPLREDELELLPSLMKLRLCQSLLIGQLAFKKEPTNEYVFDTNKRGWLLLELLLNDQRFSDNKKLLDSWLANF